MKRLLLLLISVCLITGCSAPTVASQGTSSLISVLGEFSSPASSQFSQPMSNTASSNTPSTPSITSSAESEPALTGMDLYMKCFNEGKYDIYNLKIGDPIQKAIDEFGQGIKEGYGLGAICYKFKNFVVAFSEGNEPDDYTIKGFDIVKDGITAFGLTTGLSTVEDIKKSFNIPENEWFVAQYAYENYIVVEDPYDEGDDYQYIAFYSKNEKHYLRLYFEYGVLKVISLD